ncbi:hypothetical protein Tco_1090407 [Tanacetum coccineum]|uniref:Reverse transcriptase domain-containing protein n=1 Tax=Tanacetum coccineum TaxID=301880 RepID=A0ABQ5I5C7_9ASTR
MEQMTFICDMVGQYMQKMEEDRIAEDQAAKDRYWKIPICYDDADDEESSIPLKDIIISRLPPDDESFSEEDVPMENFKFFSNPLFDLYEEIVSTEIDSLLDEFAGELILLKSIPPGIDDDNLDPEGEIHLVERLLYDNSFPRPPEELNVENSIKSFSPSPIPVKDSNSFIEEIDLFLTPDDSMPLGIENDDYDSEGDILFLKELLSNDSSSLPENE